MSLHSDLHNDLSASYQKFLADRQATKKAQFSVVIHLGMRGMGVSLLFIGIILLPGELGDRVTTDIFNQFAVLIAIFSFMLISTLPVDELDLDKFMEKHHLIRTVLGCVMLLMALGGSFYHGLWGQTLIWFWFIAVFAALFFIFRLFIVKCFKGSFLPSLMAILSFWLISLQMGTGFIIATNVAFFPYNTTKTFVENQPGAGESTYRMSRAPEFDVTNSIIGWAHVAGAFAIAFWLFSSYRIGASPTLTTYETLYAWYGCGGIFSLAFGIIHMLNEDTMRRHDDTSEDAIWIKTGSNVIQGLVQVLPILVVVVVGRENIFMYTARKFDQNKSRSESDGAFIAALLDTTTVELGKEFWVHRDAPNEFFPKFDPRRNWLQGWIMDIGEETVTVIIEKERGIARGDPGLGILRILSKNLKSTKKISPEGVQMQGEEQRAAKYELRLSTFS